MSEVLPKGAKRCARCGATENPGGTQLCRHHIDGNHDNDVVENVEWLCNACHTAHHCKGREFSDEHRANLSAAMKGKKRPAASAALKGRRLSEEHRAKISIAMKGKKRPAISAAMKGKQRAALSAEHRAKISASVQAFWQRRADGSIRANQLS